MINTIKFFLLPLFIFVGTVTPVYASPTITEYAKCSGILIVAAAVAADKKDAYLNDANLLQKKASKLKGYDKGVYNEISFDSSGTYVEILKRNSASITDFWSDAGYCRGLAQ